MNLSTQNELSSLMYGWLSLFEGKISRTFCKDEILSHPDYPAMTAAVDFLEAGGMAYEAVQADASYIHEFNYPLIAHIKQPGNEYMHILSNSKAWDAEKEITKDWSGIVIFPEKNAKWKNEENDAALKKEKQQQIIFISWCAIGLLLLGGSIYLHPSIPFNLFGLFSLAGLISNILQEDISYKRNKCCIPTWVLWIGSKALYQRKKEWRKKIWSLRQKLLKPTSL